MRLYQIPHPRGAASFLRADWINPSSVIPSCQQDSTVTFTRRQNRSGSIEPSSSLAYSASVASIIIRRLSIKGLYHGRLLMRTAFDLVCIFSFVFVVLLYAGAV